MPSFELQTLERADQVPNRLARSSMEIPHWPTTYRVRLVVPLETRSLARLSISERMHVNPPASGRVMPLLFFLKIDRKHCFSPPSAIGMRNQFKICFQAGTKLYLFALKGCSAPKFWAIVEGRRKPKKLCRTDGISWCSCCKFYDPKLDNLKSSKLCVD